MSDASAAFRRVVCDCLAATSDEMLSVVTDPRMRSLAEGLHAVARDVVAEAVVIEMDERPSNGSEPPRAVAAAMLASDVVVALTTKSLSHTEARHAATRAGARIASMPRASLDMLARTMAADPDAVRRRSRAVADALTRAREVRVTSPEGTDVTFVVEDRTALADDGDLRAPGAFGNLPAGEAFVAPVEGRTSGRIVFDGSVAKLGGPLDVTIRAGYATELAGEPGRRFRELVGVHGRDAFAVAELGIGTNEAARLTGDVLEDEKVLGTVHVAFGDNHSFGGNVRVGSHEDLVITHPTLAIDGVNVLTQGRLLV